MAAFRRSSVSILARFVVCKVALGLVCLPVLRPYLLNVIPPNCKLIFSLVLHLSEGQAGEAW
jgi:hypothetical protein